MHVARQALGRRATTERARHECGGEGCGGLFLDTSRNRRRRRCTMQSRGKGAKARRSYEPMRNAR